MRCRNKWTNQEVSYILEPRSRHSALIFAPVQDTNNVTQLQTFESSTIWKEFVYARFRSNGRKIILLSACIAPSLEIIIAAK